MNKRFIVNAMTFARVPLILVWLVLAVVAEYSFGWSRFWIGTLATTSMFFSGITDLFDGKLARKWGVVSTLGKMADPLMDKVFYVVAFPTIAWAAAHQGVNEAHALILLGFAILYMLRDLWVTFMRSVGSMYGADVSAKFIGKVRTALSFLYAGFGYTYLAWHHVIPEWLNTTWLWICYSWEALLIALTVMSLVTYTRDYSPYLKKALENK